MLHCSNCCLNIIENVDAVHVVVRIICRLLKLRLLKTEPIHPLPPLLWLRHFILLARFVEAVVGLV